MIKTIDYKGAKCFYNVKGEGKAVMLVHGFMEEGSMWTGALTVLSRNYKVIVPDLPRFGKSTVDNWQLTVGNEGLTIEWYAKCLLEILKKEKVKELILLGHSMGGYITLSFAEKYGKMLSGFGLINSHCFEDSAEKKENRRKTIAFIRKHGTSHFVKELYDKIFEEGYKKKHGKVVEPMIEKALKYAPEAVIAATEAMIKRSDKSAVLSKAQVPVLMVGGKGDETVPLELVLKQASLPNITDIHLFGGSKHMTIFEKRSLCLRVIGDFCERC